MAGEEAITGAAGGAAGAGGLGGLLGNFPKGLGVLVSALFVVSLLQGMKDRKKMMQEQEDMKRAQEQAAMGPMGGMGGGMGGGLGGMNPAMLQQAMMSQMGQGMPQQ